MSSRWSSPAICAPMPGGRESAGRRGERFPLISRLRHQPSAGASPRYEWHGSPSGETCFFAIAEVTAQLPNFRSVGQIVAALASAERTWNEAKKHWPQEHTAVKEVMVPIRPTDAGLQAAFAKVSANAGQFSVLIPPFDLSNPSSILKDDRVAGCQFRVARGSPRMVLRSQAAAVRRSSTRRLRYLRPLSGCPGPRH